MPAIADPYADAAERKLNAQITALQDDLALLELTLSEAKHQVNGAKAGVAKAQIAVDAANAALREKRTELTKADGRYESLRLRVTAKRGELAQAQEARQIVQEQGTMPIVRSAWQGLSK